MPQNAWRAFLKGSQPFTVKGVARHEVSCALEKHIEIRLFLLGAQFLLPFLEQRLAAFRIAVLQYVEMRDAVGAEMAEGGAQFAPGDDVARRLVVSDADRPDRALGAALELVAVLDLHLAAFADGAAQP